MNISQDYMIEYANFFVGMGEKANVSLMRDQLVRFLRMTPLLSVRPMAIIAMVVEGKLTKSLYQF